MDRLFVLFFVLSCCVCFGYSLESEDQTKPILLMCCGFYQWNIQNKTCLKDGKELIQFTMGLDVYKNNGALMNATTLVDKFELVEDEDRKVCKIDTTLANDEDDFVLFENGQILKDDTVLMPGRFCLTQYMSNDKLKYITLQCKKEEIIVTRRSTLHFIIIPIGLFISAVGFAARWMRQRCSSSDIKSERFV